MRPRTPICGHPSRKHRAKGLCGACYEREHTQKMPGYKARKQEEKVRRYARNLGKYRLVQGKQNARRGGYQPLDCDPAWLEARILSATTCEFPGCTRSLPHLRDRQVDHDHVTGRFRGILCKTCNAQVVGTIEKNWGRYNQYLTAAKEGRVWE